MTLTIIIVSVTVIVNTDMLFILCDMLALGAVTFESSTDLPLNDTSIDLVCFTVGERFSSYHRLKES